jgi:shikimate 5-dehydrogenase
VRCRCGIARLSAPAPWRVSSGCGPSVINCTSVGLEGSAGARDLAGPGPASTAGTQPSADQPDSLSLLGLSADRLEGYSRVVDLVYRADGPTPLLAAAAEHGARTLDGLEILLAQGAVSFELWTGREAPLEVMRSALGEANAG